MCVARAKQAMQAIREALVSHRLYGVVKSSRMRRVTLLHDSVCFLADLGIPERDGLEDEHPSQLIFSHRGCT